MSKWYSIKAMADEARATVTIDGVIGSKGVAPSAFIDELNAISAKHIDLNITSFGGSVLGGIAMKTAIKKHPAHVVAHIDSIAGSIATEVALGCDEIRIAEDAFVMIHNPSSRAEGEAGDLRKEADVLDKMAAGMAQSYADKMGVTTDEAAALMAEETWYRGQEAVDAKYADAVYAGTQAVALIDADRFTANTPKEVIDRFTKPPKGSEQEALTKESEAMPEETITPDSASEVADEVVAPVADVVTDEDTEQTVAEAVQEALATERQRTAAITAVGGKFGFGEDAEQFIASGRSVDDFRAHVLNKSPDDWRASLAVKNPSSQPQDDDADDSEAKAAVAKIKERRKARNGG